MSVPKLFDPALDWIRYEVEESGGHSLDLTCVYCHEPLSENRNMTCPVSDVALRWERKVNG